MEENNDVTLSEIIQFTKAYYHEGYDEWGEENGEESDTVGSHILQMKVGALHELLARIDITDEELTDEETEAVDEYVAHHFAEVLYGLIHFAIDLDVDIADAVAGDIEEYEKQKEVLEAMENGDFEAVADYIGEMVGEFEDVNVDEDVITPEEGDEDTGLGFQ